MNLAESLIPLIAQGRAKKYNPIYVYGQRYQIEQFSEKVQLACLKATPNMNICYLSGEDFSEQIALSIRGCYEDTFRTRIRMYEMLIFTDIDKIQGKNKCMQEFYSLFDHYFENGRMIIIGSSVPCSDLTAMEERVNTQLQSGLVVKLQAD